MTSPNQSNHFSSFAKLKEPERYSPWSFFVQTWLQGKGLWDYITGEEVEPHLATIDPTTGIIMLPTLDTAQ